MSPNAQTIPFFSIDTVFSKAGRSQSALRRPEIRTFTWKIAFCIANCMYDDDVTCERVHDHQKDGQVVQHCNFRRESSLSISLIFS